MLSISVVTVCRNAGATITRALSSVCSQDHPQVQHILVDGNSDDNTLDLIYKKGLRDTGIVISEKDDGIYDAMNKGIAISTGDIIAFLNADDFYKDVNVLSTIAQIMESQSLDVAYGDVDFFAPEMESHIIRHYDSSRFSPDTLAWGWMPAHPAIFVRRSIFNDYGAFDKSYRIAGDFEFIARIFTLGHLKSAYLPKIFVSMQVGGVSTRGWRSTFLLNLEMMRACRANRISTNWLMLLSRYALKVIEFFPSKSR